MGNFIKKERKKIKKFEPKKNKKLHLIVAESGDIHLYDIEEKFNILYYHIERFREIIRGATRNFVVYGIDPDSEIFVKLLEGAYDLSFIEKGRT